MARPDRSWIVWFEDASDEGEKRILTNEPAAKRAVSDLLQYVMDRVDEEWKAAEEQGAMDEFHEELKELSRTIRRTLATDVWAALELWREFESEDEEGTLGWFGTVRVEEVGSARAPQEWRPHRPSADGSRRKVR